MRATGAVFLLFAAAACRGDAPAGSDDVRAPADLLVLGGTVVTMDASRRVIPDGGVAAADGRIVAVGAAAAVGAAYEAPDTVVAGPEDLVIPGLVNGHGHAAMTLLRGVADDLQLEEWLEGYIFPAEATLVDEDFVRLGARLAALEMIRTGTTTFADMYYFEDVVAEVVDEAGLRGVLGETVLDFPAPDRTTPEGALAYAERFLARWSGHPRVTPAVAPHAAYTAGPATLTAAAQLARGHGAPILIHLAETRENREDILARYGASPVGHLAALGFLGPDVVAAHAIWLDEEDVRLLAGSGAGVVHNPESNLKLASGVMPVAELRAAGVPVGLGTDGAASNNDLDMFDAMNVAALLQKHITGDPTALPAWDAFALATVEGARALGLADRIGSLEVGKRADLVVVDGSAPHQTPRYDPYSHLAYVTRGSDVRATVVEGRVLYRDGAYATLDAASILASAREAARPVREAAGGR